MSPFRAGGPLHYEGPAVYVERKADRDAWAYLQAMEYFMLLILTEFVAIFLYLVIQYAKIFHYRLPLSYLLLPDDGMKEIFFEKIASFVFV